MYKIFADDTLIYDSTLEDYKIGKGTVTLEAGKSGSFVFSVYPDHPYYDKFVQLKTVITVYKRGRIVFRGRVLDDSTDYWNNKVLTCSGELDFLNDSIVRPFSFSGTPEQFFKAWITNHNSQVDSFKQFKIGSCTVVDPNNYIARESEGYETTLDSLTGRTVDSGLGGYLYITHGDDGTEEQPTIHYLAEYPHTATQSIEFGVNLMDYTKKVSSADLATAIIPLGATVEKEITTEDADGNEVTETVQEVVTIKDVNDGKDYIYSEAAVALRGWVFKTVDWDDVTLPSNLLTKAQAYLQTVVNQAVTIELNAVDLNLLDRDIESFRVCDRVHVRSVPHGVDTTMLCNKQTMDLLAPENDTVTLGVAYSTFTASSTKVARSVQKVSSSTTSKVSVVSAATAKNASDIVELDGRVTTLETTGGPAGENGATFTPSVDSSGNLSWTNDKGLTNPETVNIKGPTGATGPAGKDGATGPAGADGQDGVTFTPSVAADGTLSWTNDGGLGNPSPVNIMGPAGPAGADGKDGATGPAGADGKDGVTFTPAVASDGTLSWTNDGGRTDPSPVNIMGPAGPAGVDGKDGSAGPAGADGQDGQDGVTFTPAVTADGTISWTNDGGRTNPSPVNIKGPAGAAGKDGSTGPAGADGQDGVTFTPSLASDGTLSWTNDGGRANPSPVNIKGPAGPAGADGKDGAAGPAGADGAAGADGKSAYSYAQDGGYTGTEAEFTEALGSIGQGGANITFATEEPTEAEGADGELRLVHRTREETTAILPDGYTQLEYIQSSGTQYIDTGIKFASSNIKFYIKWQDLSSYSGKCVFGTGDDTNKGYFVCYENSLYIGSGSVATLGISDTSVPHELSIELTSAGGLSYALDGTSKTGSYTAPVNSTYSLYLLNQNPQNRCRTAKLYSCQVYDNGALVRDFVPCKNGSGTVGLYDLVSGAFYGNAGTGAFTAGTVIETTTKEITESMAFFKTGGSWYGVGVPMTAAEIRAICT